MMTLCYNCFALIEASQKESSFTSSVVGSQRIVIKSRIHPADPGSHVYIKQQGIF